MPDLTVVTTAYDDATLLSVSGELDLDSAHVLRRATLAALDAARPPRLLLELSGLSFVDSSGLHVLVDTWRRARHRDGWVRLVAPSRAVVRLLTLTRLDSQLPAYPDPASAYAGCDVPSVPEPRSAVEGRSEAPRPDGR
jgi:anti-anti-sigma factor